MRGLFPERDLLYALHEIERGHPYVRAVSMSPVLVSVSDTLGSDDCWCGQKSGHDWPGKADGAAHPRYPR